MRFIRDFVITGSGLLVTVAGAYTFDASVATAVCLGGLSVTATDFAIKLCDKR